MLDAVSVTVPLALTTAPALTYQRGVPWKPQVRPELVDSRRAKSTARLSAFSALFAVTSFDACDWMIGSMLLVESAMVYLVMDVVSG